MKNTWEEVDERNVEVTKELLKLCNLMGNEKTLSAQITSKLRREHRTIQQSFIGVLRKVVLDYAEECEEYRDYDLRNKDSKLWAKIVAEADAEAGGYGFSYI